MSPRSFLGAAFQRHFQVSPRPFGQNSGPWVGVSDDAKGVQWNAGIMRESGVAYLGVNLEGMKYRDWPIANLLLAEKHSPELTQLAAKPWR